MSNDLSLIATDDLLAELAKRNTAILFCAVKPLTGTVEERVVDYRGGLTSCVGLARWAEVHMLQEAEKI